MLIIRGTAKNLLAKSIAQTSCAANIKALFNAAIDMINRLIAADADRWPFSGLFFRSIAPFLTVAWRQYKGKRSSRVIHVLVEDGLTENQVLAAFG